MKLCLVTALAALSLSLSLSLTACDDKKDAPVKPASSSSAVNTAKGAPATASAKPSEAGW
jgi:uncharacterized lipoprotein YehR (DUF1307 family)